MIPRITAEQSRDQAADADAPVRILLIEDNPGDALLIEQMLGDTYHVTSVERAAAGVSALEADDYDVVLLDLSLPDASGLEGFARIRNAAPDLPLIVLTGLDDNAAAMQSVNFGAQDYLVKGRVDADGLLRAIRYAIERQRIVSSLQHSLEREQVVSDRLRESERRYRSLVTSIPGAVYRCAATRPWICDFMSSPVAEITGYHASEFVDRRQGWRGLVHPEDAGWVCEALEASLTEDRPYRLEYRIVHAAGDVRWVLDQGVGVRGQDGELRLLEGVICDISRRRAAEEAARRLEMLEERERIARELHDGVIQSLFALGMGLQSAGRSPEASDPIRARISQSIDRIDGIIGELRSYVLDLRPSLLGGLRLEQALRALAGSFEVEGVAVTVTIEPPAAAAASGNGRGEHLVQIAREALANAVRHSGSPTVSLRLTADAGTVTLEVADRGRGFDYPWAGPGQGLANLQERAGILGGVLQVTSTAGGGTRVVVLMPVDEGRSGPVPQSSSAAGMPAQ